MSFSCLIVLCPLTSFLFNDPHVEGGGGAVNPVLYPPSAVPRRSKCVYGQWRVHKHDEKVAEIYRASPDSQEKEKIKPESIKQAPITGLLWHQ